MDRTYLLATSHYDRHATYVGLSRARPKELVHDYLDCDPAAHSSPGQHPKASGAMMDAIDVRQLQAAQRPMREKRGPFQGLMLGS